MTEYKAFHCRCCRCQLAVTNGERLVLGTGAYSDEAIPIRCSACGLRQIWKPIKKVVDVSAALVYSNAVPA